MTGRPTAPDPAPQLVRVLAQQGRTLAVAESLTGGLVAAAVVDVPGASAVLRGGVVAYATDLKTRLLDVDPDLLSRVGPVDPGVAEAMARGAAARLGADYAVATTGVAGPDPQDGHPVGEVHLAVVGPGEQGPVTVITLRLDAGLGRAGIRAAACEEALALALDHVGS